ncbi:hypothetical protein A2V49_00100 [candidate division WWE3 bacterium RBG_19FT_COMBO_34_6]|uniref:Nucleoid-associated protein, YbaB/EbfC family n=1 Tax=candidate division WWE3 bacterium RBG_19FT_COMBO_34_6 TaxID=1802612 RepID=A0A1F4UJT1_UNCKA|nr:MAG: hypothetical protein A2V49_00100 [candidate division WWE3 bacterium RBG_19FT_COMBO_34_6]
MINPKEILRLRKAQSEMQKQLEQIFATEEKRGFRVVVRGDRKIESIEIDGEEQKDLKEIINSAMKEVNKRAEKQLRGQLGDLGFPGM